MDFVEQMRQQVLAGGQVTREQALELTKAPLEALSQGADRLRAHFCGDRFDLCTIVNGKCGRCSEDCKYCAQSAHYATGLEESYPLLSTAELVRGAAEHQRRGVLRYSIVTSGRKLSDREVEQACESVRAIREQVGIAVCVSFGLLGEEAFRMLREAGASRVHCNLETSRRYFPQVCTTHTYDEKIETLKAAQRAGLSVCSGGILGLGETMEDRIDMALTARALGVKSVPVNLLNPIPGTPYAHNPVLPEEEVRRVVAIFRFLIPDGDIRLAGGRGLLEDRGARCFCAGANAAISGDMLTTAGITVQRDRAMLQELGYLVRLEGTEGN